MHLRSLATGAELGAGVQVVDSPLTDPSSAFGAGIAFAAGSGIVFAVHDDGGGIDIARIDLEGGARIDPDAAVPDSLGCSVAGAPLLTPPAADGSRLLFFTMAGTCSRGASLVRVPVGADASLGPITSAATPGIVSGVAPILVVLGSPPQFVVAVPRVGGLDLRRADGDFAKGPDGTVELGANPAALAAPDTAPLPTPSLVALTAQNGATRVVRLDQGPDGSLTAAAVQSVGGAPAALALGGTTQQSLVVSTSTGLSVLRAADLSLVGTAPGAAGGVSSAGDLAFAVRAGRLVALRLTDATATDVGATPAVTYAPALARGLISLGPSTLRTTDVTAPAVSMPADARGLGTLSAIASDDRGIASVQWWLGRRVLRTASIPVSGSAFEPGARYEVSFADGSVAPGAYRLSAVARDGAGNTGRAQRPVRVSCDRTRRGGPRGDVLRGRAGRDCLYGGGGDDLIIVRGGGADRVVCGAGRDRVRADRDDRIADDCERVRRQRP